MLPSFLRSDLQKAVAVLVYGPDEGGVRERVNAMTAAVGGMRKGSISVMRAYSQPAVRAAVIPNVMARARPPA